MNGVDWGRLTIYNKYLKIFFCRVTMAEYLSYEETAAFIEATKWKGYKFLSSEDVYNIIVAIPYELYGEEPQEQLNPSFAFCIYICIYILSLRCTTNFVPTASLDILFLSMHIERRLLGRQSPFCSFCSSHVQLQRFENKVNTNFYSI